MAHFPVSPSMGFHLFVVKRVIHKKDGRVQNYPADRLLHIIDYARVGVWEYVIVKEGFVLKRLIDKHVGFADGQWQECRELCAVNRGWGATKCFKQAQQLIEEDIRHAYLQTM